MTQSEANIITAAARVALELERGGYDPFETRMAVVDLCEAVKRCASLALPVERKPDPICVSCDGGGCSNCLPDSSVCPKCQRPGCDHSC